MVKELFHKNVPENPQIDNWGTILPRVIWCVANFVHSTTLTFQCDFKCKTLAPHDLENFTLCVDLYHDLVRKKQT